MTKATIKNKSVQLYGSVTSRKPRLTIYKQSPSEYEPTKELSGTEVLTVVGSPIPWGRDTMLPVKLSSIGLQYASHAANAAKMQGKKLGAYYKAWLKKENPVVYVKASQVNLYDEPGTPKTPEKKNNFLWLGIAAIGLALILKTKKNV